MRITGGFLCGHKINVPPGSIRPTQDRVREAIFPMIREKIVGARVIDLFAGSGALGLEAWSWGAQYVCWVEGDKRAFRVLKDNGLSLCTGLDRPIQFVMKDVFRYIRHVRPREAFDVVFADPPYSRQGDPSPLEKILPALDRSTMVKEGTWLVFEQGVEQQVTASNRWRLKKNKEYGGTRVLIFER